MNIHLVLRTNYVNKKGLQQVQLYYCSNNDQVRLDTGIRIRPKDWNESKQQILSSVSEIGKTSKELNDKLNEKKNKVLNIVTEFKKEHENGTSVVPDPDITYVKEKYNEVQKKIKEEQTVLEHLQEFINDRKSMLDAVHEGQKMDTRSGQYKTLSHYEVLYNDLVRFSKKTNRTYHFRDIDKKFKDNLIKFYLDKGSKKEKKRGLSNSTLRKKFTKLKSFLNAMTEDGVNKFLKYSKAKTEDELYRLFLETHFQSPESAIKFKELMSWEKLNNTGDSGLRKTCHDFFKQSGIKIGGHRKYFNCMKPNERVEYTVEVLSSYRAVIKKYKSQRNFFEIDGNPDFDDLYSKRMIEINHFEPRLPRFDHLEKVSRTFNFCCIPKRFYVEDATGPFDGLTYLILGQKFRKRKKELNKILLANDFTKKWNPNVKSKYQLTDKESRDSILQKMEQWAINEFKNNKKLRLSQLKNPAFVFDLETNICNWQKKKKAPIKTH